MNTAPPASPPLMTITVVDKNGDTYLFPGVDLSLLRSRLPKSGDTPATTPCLQVMNNATIALLSIPFLFVKSVRAGTELLWHERGAQEEVPGDSRR